MKKYLLFLSLALLTAVTASAYDFSVQNDDGVDIYYDYNAGYTSVTVTYNTDDYGAYTDAEIRIPNEVKYNNKNYPVNAIGNNAFADCADVVTVSLPTSIKTIGTEAFANCEELTTINIPIGLTTIGTRAFYNCGKLDEISFPASVISIGTSAFYGTGYYNSPYNWNGDVLYIDLCLIEAKPSLAPGKYTIKDNTKTIADWAFSMTSGLTEVEFPATLVTIGNSAFSNCTELTMLNFPEGLITIGNNAFEYCSSLVSVRIPASVTSIGNSAFVGTYALKVVYEYNTDPAAIHMGTKAFPEYDDDWTTCKLFVPEASVTAYSETIPWSVWFDGRIEPISETFAVESGIKTIYYSVNPDGVSVSVTKNGGDDGYYSGDIEIPASVTNGSMVYPVTAIGDEAFMECSALFSISLPASITSFGYAAFANCSSLHELNIPESVTQMGHFALSGCAGLTEINLPEGLESISLNMCADCTGIESIVVPSSVTFINGGAFFGCEKLASITMPNTVTVIGSYAFDHTAYYNNADNWEDGVLYIGKYLIKAKADELTGYYTIPEGTLAIASASFSHCPNLAGVELPNSLKQIPGTAFSGCYSLASAIIPWGVESIQQDAFSFCSSLTYVEIPGTVNFIGSAAFYDCTALEELYVYNEYPETITLGTQHDFTPFTGVDTALCVLYVPENSVERYMNAPLWGDFSQIQETAMVSGIESIESEDNAATAADVIYDLTGRRIKNPTRGLYIVNGRKVIL